jgi:hypothetical protein
MNPGFPPQFIPAKAGAGMTTFYETVLIDGNDRRQQKSPLAPLSVEGLGGFSDDKR